MPVVSQLGLIDLLVLLVVVLAVVGALRRGGGVLAAVGSGLGTLVACWLVLVALAAWAPKPFDRMARDTAVLAAVPAPHRALDQAGALLGGGRPPR